MFIKTIVKTDKKTGKRYDYYRLCESYRLNGKPRHRTILSLGNLEYLFSKEDRKLLADRIESMLTGAINLFDNQENPNISKYAQEYYNKIVEGRLYDAAKGKTTDTNVHSPDYQEIDINTFETSDVRWIFR